MTNVTIQRIREADRVRPLLQETSDLLDKVRSRAFELFERRGRASGNDMGDWLQAEKEMFRVPEVELAESDGEFQLQLALPGFDANDVRVAALPNAVIVEGEAAHQHRGGGQTVHFCEFGERRLFRRIPLPKPVDIDHASATLDKGVLKIRVAKVEQDKGKKAAA